MFGHHAIPAKFLLYPKTQRIRGERLAMRNEECPRRLLKTAEPAQDLVGVRMHGQAFAPRNEIAVVKPILPDANNVVGTSGLNPPPHIT
jgi:hypothetical protein